jgi:hypothetical protein
MFRQIIANNRAGGWRRIKAAREGPEGRGGRNRERWECGCLIDDVTDVAIEVPAQHLLASRVADATLAPMTGSEDRTPITGLTSTAGYGVILDTVHSLPAS